MNPDSVLRGTVHQTLNNQPQPPTGPPNPEAFRHLVEKYHMELLQTPAH